MKPTLTIILSLVTGVVMGQTKHLTWTRNYSQDSAKVLRDSISQLKKDVDHYFHYHEDYQKLRDSLNTHTLAHSIGLSGDTTNWIQPKTMTLPNFGNLTYSIRIDTVKVWIKEVVFMNEEYYQSHKEGGYQPREMWYKGYEVKDGSQYVTYLYEDKTKVLGHVINSIERK